MPEEFIECSSSKKLTDLFLAHVKEQEFQATRITAIEIAAKEIRCDIRELVECFLEYKSRK